MIGCVSQALVRCTGASPLPILWASAHRGNSGGLATASSPPAASQRTRPGDPAPNWADTSAATQATRPRLRVNREASETAGMFREIKTRFMEMRNPPALFPAYLHPQRRNGATVAQLGHWRTCLFSYFTFHQLYYALIYFQGVNGWI